MMSHLVFGGCGNHVVTGFTRERHRLKSKSYHAREESGHLGLEMLVGDLKIRSEMLIVVIALLVGVWSSPPS